MLLFLYLAGKSVTQRIREKVCQYVLLTLLNSKVLLHEFYTSFCIKYYYCCRNEYKPDMVTLEQT